jgi:hypothetical protein
MFGHIRCGTCREGTTPCLVCAYAAVVLGPHGDPFATPVIQRVFAVVDGLPPGSHALVVAKHAAVGALLRLACTARKMAVWLLDPTCPEDVAGCVHWCRTRKCRSTHAVVIAPAAPLCPPGLLARMSHCVVVAPVARKVLRHLAEQDGAGPAGVTWIAVEGGIHAGTSRTMTTPVKAGDDAEEATATPENWRGLAARRLGTMDLWEE